MSGNGQERQEIHPAPTNISWEIGLVPSARGVLVRNEISTVTGTFVFFLPADGAIGQGEQLQRLGVQARSGLIITGDLPPAPTEHPEAN